jgi:hypothetical protein
VNYQSLTLQRLSVQFSIKDLGVDDVQRSFILDDFESFVQRYGKTVESGTLFVYMKSHGSNFKGDQLVHCRLQLRTVKGSFFSSGEDWGVEQTFHLALDRLSARYRLGEITEKYIKKRLGPLIKKHL